MRSPFVAPSLSVRCVSSMRVQLACLAMLPGVSACRDQTGIGPEITSIDRNWVTPAVAAQLDAAGRFPGTRPVLASMPAVSVDAARALAKAWVNTVGTVSAQVWSDDAGVAVTAAKLVQCSRIDFVESAYETIPPTRTQFFRNVWGPHWLVRFCQNGSVPVVEVSVAASAADIAVMANGRLDGQAVHAAFDDHGIAQSSKQYPSVEDGARFVATSTVNSGALIAEVPEIIHAGRGTAPWVVSWIFTQTAAASVRSRITVFGASKRSLIARPISDSTAESDTLVDFSPDQGGASIPVVISRRASALQVSDVILFLSQPRG